MQQRSRVRVRLALVGASFCALAATARGGSAAGPAPEANPDSALSLALSAIDGDPLTLEQAFEAALAGATGLRAAEAGLREAQGARMSAAGSFDPELFADLTRSKEEVPSASPFSGGSILRPETTLGSAGLRWTLPLGTEIRGSFQGTRTSTNSAFAALNPQYDGTARLDFTQPLLKGFGPSASSGLATASRRLEAARADLEDEQLGTRAAVESAYWELYAAERDLAVQRLIRDRARSIHEEARTRAAVGLVGPGQVANATVFLAEQEHGLLDAEDRLDAVSDGLAALIGRRPGPGYSRFRPVDEPPRGFPVAVPDTLVARALRHNGALRALGHQVAALDAAARGAAWDALPSVDLVASVGGNALAGEPRDIVFGGDTLRADEAGGWGDLIDEALTRKHPTWSAGLRVTFPLTLREGRGERMRAGAEAARAKELLEAARRGVEREVRALWRDLSKSEERLRLAREGVDASLEQVRIGVLEYRAGRTSAFELVRLGADLAAAQQRYSRALVRAARASAELKRLTGGAPSGETTRSAE